MVRLAPPSRSTIRTGRRDSGRRSDARQVVRLVRPGRAKASFGPRCIGQVPPSRAGVPAALLSAQPIAVLAGRVCGHRYRRCADAGNVNIGAWAGLPRAIALYDSRLRAGANHAVYAVSVDLDFGHAIIWFLAGVLTAAARQPVWPKAMKLSSRAPRSCRRRHATGQRPGRARASRSASSRSAGSTPLHRTAAVPKAAAGPPAASARPASSPLGMSIAGS